MSNICQALFSVPDIQPYKVRFLSCGTFMPVVLAEMRDQSMGAKPLAKWLKQNRPSIKISVNRIIIIIIAIIITGH